MTSPYIPEKTAIRYRSLQLTQRTQTYLPELPPGTGNQRLTAELGTEQVRRLQVLLRRRYYEGRQFDVLNARTATDTQIDISERVPEHDRAHAYSDQIQDSLDYLADQLGSGFAMEGPDSAAATVILEDSRLDEEAIVDLASAVLADGDVPIEVRWDPVRRRAWLQPWATEQLFVLSDDPEQWHTHPSTLVIFTDYEWVPDATDPNILNHVLRRDHYTLEPPAAAADIAAGEPEAAVECVKRTFYEAADDPSETVRLGIPFIPWVLLRANSTARQIRGDSAITDRTMEHADRYDSLMQEVYLSARFNAHSTLAVVGDAAHLKLTEAGTLDKDVADVIGFPGGTDVKALSLPTDLAPIEYHEKHLARGIYRTFGLRMVDSLDDLSGDLSGYALEILNRRGEGTLARYRRTITRDLLAAFTAAFNMAAVRAGAPWITTDGAVTAPPDTEAEMEALTQAWWRVPLRQPSELRIEIRFGSIYIADLVASRDDYTAGIISRAEALRIRGKTSQEISDIEAEIADEKASAMPEGLAPGFPPAGGNGQLDDDGQPVPARAGASATRSGDDGD